MVPRRRAPFGDRVRLNRSPSAARTLSPSDFGFHNAIRRAGGGLAFVDFEYFGWDDPAKTIADYLLHPAMALGDALKRRFADQVQAAFGELPGSPRARAWCIHGLGLKWALILVNDFLPERFSQPDAEWQAGTACKGAGDDRSSRPRIRRQPVPVLI